jgi:hypothetical protein
LSAPEGPIGLISMLFPASDTTPRGESEHGDGAAAGASGLTSIGKHGDSMPEPAYRHP